MPRKTTKTTPAGLIDPLRDALRQRIDEGYTIAGIAEACEIPRPNLSAFLNGRRQINFVSADRLARVVGVGAALVGPGELDQG